LGSTLLGKSGQAGTGSEVGEDWPEDKKIAIIGDTLAGGASGKANFTESDMEPWLASLPKNRMVDVLKAIINASHDRQIDLDVAIGLSTYYLKRMRDENARANMWEILKGLNYVKKNRSR
jgi:glyoxylase-like metal-dependent hydrolase (beta-lactamase superfamily II)